MERVVRDYHKQDMFKLANHESRMYRDRHDHKFDSGVVSCTGMTCNLNVQVKTNDDSKHLDCACRTPSPHSLTHTIVANAKQSFGTLRDQPRIADIMKHIGIVKRRIRATIDDFKKYIKGLKPYVSGVKYDVLYGSLACSISKARCIIMGPVCRYVSYS